MDALLLALILTLLLDQGTATQAFVARSGPADAGRVTALMAVVAGNAAVAAAMGAAVGLMLSAEARLLFFAIALLFGAAGHLLAPFRPAKPLHAQSLSLSSLARYALRRAGENGAFVVAGVAAFTTAPILAATGAILGGWVALIPPLALGGTVGRSTGGRAALMLSGLVLLCAGIACAVNALRLT